MTLGAGLGKIAYFMASTKRAHCGCADGSSLCRPVFNTFFSLYQAVANVSFVQIYQAHTYLSHAAIRGLPNFGHSFTGDVEDSTG